MRNLDTLAAQTAQRVIAATSGFKASEVENLATKTLGVVQENGVYAAAIFLYSRSGTETKIAPFVRKGLLSLAAQEVVMQPVPEDQAQLALKFITDHIANDLDSLLLVKQLWEQTLIYVRYGAKARG